MDPMIAAAAVLVAASAPSQALDAEQAAILQTVDAALAAVSAQDEAALAPLLLPDTLFFRDRTGKDGKPVATVMSRAKMMESLRGEKRGLLELRSGNPTILVRNGLAQVWTFYTFDVAGKRSHCGVDSFGLLKVDGQWRIASLGWTHETEGCPK